MPRRTDLDLPRRLGAGPAPLDTDRAGRVALLGRWAEAELAGQAPDRAAALYVAGAVARWLKGGGDLEKDYLRVHQRGSHRTPALIWQAIIADERQTEKTRAE